MITIARLLFVIFFCFSFSFSSPAQVTVDAVSDELILNPTQSFSFSHTCNGNQRVLFLSVICSGGTNPSVALARYNGVPMSLLWFSSSGTGAQIVWMLENPDAGTNALAVYLPFTPNAIMASGISFNGANTTSPVGASAGVVDFNDTCSVQLNSVYNSSLLLFFGGNPFCASADNLFLGSAQTPLMVLDNTASRPEGASSVMDAPFAGSYTLFEGGHCDSAAVFGFALEIKSADVSTAVHKDETNGKMTLFPNPSDSHVNIHTPEPLEQAYITVVDIAGKVVYSDTFSGTDKILDLSILKSGLYFLRLVTENGTFERRFTKA